MKLRDKLSELEDRLQRWEFCSFEQQGDILLELIRCVRDLEAGTRHEQTTPDTERTI